MCGMNGKCQMHIYVKLMKYPVDDRYIEIILAPLKKETPNSTKKYHTTYYFKKTNKKKYINTLINYTFVLNILIMYYDLISELIGLIKIYEQESAPSEQDPYLFGLWLNEYYQKTGHASIPEPEWEGKLNGRSADSVINTSLVHLYKYARLHAKAAIVNTTFSTPDEFIYLISLVSFGSMTKTALIRLNIHEKSAGMQIVNRLISNGLVEQAALDSDKRNRMIHITPKGAQLLNESMQNIRIATMKVTEPLSHHEKMDLIRLLTKLENFHEEKTRGQL